MLVSTFSLPAFSSDQVDPRIRCRSMPQGKEPGLFVNVFQKENRFLAVFGEYWNKGHDVLATFRVRESRAPGVGAPLVYSTEGTDFKLSICDTCTPVDGMSPAVLDVRVNGYIVMGEEMLCKRAGI